MSITEGFVVVNGARDCSFTWKIARIVGGGVRERGCWAAAPTSFYLRRLNVSCVRVVGEVMHTPQLRASRPEHVLEHPIVAASRSLHRLSDGSA